VDEKDRGHTNRNEHAQEEVSVDDRRHGSGGDVAESAGDAEAEDVPAERRSFDFETRAVPGSK